jgi:hypothetical protein
VWLTVDAMSQMMVRLTSDLKVGGDSEGYSFYHSPQLLLKLPGSFNLQCTHNYPREQLTWQMTLFKVGNRFNLSNGDSLHVCMHECLRMYATCFIPYKKIDSTDSHIWLLINSIHLKSWPKVSTLDMSSYISYWPPSANEKIKSCQRGN